VKLRAEVNIGVGLPTTVPGATGELLLDWARRADAGPFSSVAVLDRVVYDSYEPFATLAAAAAATSRIRLATMIAIAFGSLGAFFALRTGSGEAVQGLFPLMFVGLFLSKLEWVIDDVAQSASGIDRQQVGLHERDPVRHGVAHRVLTRQIQRVRGDVHRQELDRV